MRPSLCLCSLTAPIFILATKLHCREGREGPSPLRVPPHLYQTQRLLPWRHSQDTKQTRMAKPTSPQPVQPPLRPRPTLRRLNAHQPTPVISPAPPPPPHSAPPQTPPSRLQHFSNKKEIWMAAASLEKQADSDGTPNGMLAPGGDGSLDTSFCTCGTIIRF